MFGPLSVNTDVHDAVSLYQWDLVARGVIAVELTARGLPLQAVVGATADTWEVVPTVIADSRVDYCEFCGRPDTKDISSDQSIVASPGTKQGPVIRLHHHPTFLLCEAWVCQVLGLPDLLKKDPFNVAFGE